MRLGTSKDVYLRIYQCSTRINHNLTVTYSLVDPVRHREREEIGVREYLHMRIVDR